MNSTLESRLTSAEIAALWNTYISDTMAVCVYKYFFQIVKDKDIKTVLRYALSLSNQHIKTITDILNKEDYPIPAGFNNEDVNVNAPPLYSDTFVLFNLRYMARIGLNLYSIALPQMARQDMVDFLINCVNSTVELTKRLINIKLEKGVYLRPPIVEIPKKIDFITEKGFGAGFFGQKRSLTTSEVTQLFVNIEDNYIGKALLTGFIQVTNSIQIKDYLTRGIKIASRHIEIFSKKLKEENLPVPLPSDTFVSDSTEAPFFDKVIMYKLTLMTAYGFQSYAFAAASCLRHDIQADFIRLDTEVAKYGADAIDIMVENRWMEQQPQAVNHAILAKN